jgi:hypothetical protein
MLEWDRIRFDKKHAGTRYAKLMFLHSMGFVVHGVHFSASRAQNVEALYFMLRWERHGFDKKRTRISYTKLLLLHPVGSMGQLVHSIASAARNVNTLFFMLRWDRYKFDKKRLDMLHRICVFASNGICGSRSAVWGMKHRRTIFHALVGLTQFP